MQITKIVLTGGPCAGKSEAAKLIKDTFTKDGYTVLFIPETATELISGGVCPWTCGTNLDYQIVQCKLQRFKVQMFDEAVHTMKEDKYLIVCDRAMLDNNKVLSLVTVKSVRLYYYIRKDENEKLKIFVFIMSSFARQHQGTFRLHKLKMRKHFFLNLPHRGKLHSRKQTSLTF